MRHSASATASPKSKKLHAVVRTILGKIDQFAIMRRPSWDGVRSLLLILPLSEGKFHIFV
jgi:hypothetical protein